MYLRLEIRVVCREFLAFKYVFIVFETNRMIIYFSVHNIHLNLWRQVENYKWIFCSQTTNIKCVY